LLVSILVPWDGLSCQLFILAPAARSCCNKYDSTWRPGGLEALKL